MIIQKAYHDLDSFCKWLNKYDFNTPLIYFLMYLVYWTLPKEDYIAYKRRVEIFANVKCPRHSVMLDFHEWLYKLN